MSVRTRLSCPDDCPLQQVTLAQSLGPKPVTYLSTSHGVELEVQAGSLVEEVHRAVTVSPRLQFVACRTEGSGRYGCSALLVVGFDIARYPFDRANFLCLLLCKILHRCACRTRRIFR